MTKQEKYKEAEIIANRVYRIFNRKEYLVYIAFKQVIRSIIRDPNNFKYGKLDIEYIEVTRWITGFQTMLLYISNEYNYDSMRLFEKRIKESPDTRYRV